MQTISNFTRYIMQVHFAVQQLGISEDWDINPDLRAHLGPGYRLGIAPKELAALIVSDHKVPEDNNA